MRTSLALPRLIAALALVCIVAPRAYALPTMIRLGYTNCAACHISPQGGGLLNDYGRGIDQAQSLRGGEYRPSARSVVRELSLGGRITQDLRTVLHHQSTWAAASPMVSSFRPRLMYRNAAEIGKGLRVSGTVTWEGESAPRPSRPYEPATSPSAFFVNTALLQYRAGKSIEFAAGRDQLPTGINMPDLNAYLKSRNRLGYYDSTTQLKMFWWGKRYQVVPYIYGPGGNEPAGERESGGGTLAEVDLLGNQRTIVGATVMRGTARNGDRGLLGAYARLGFGRWRRKGSVFRGPDTSGSWEMIPRPDARCQGRHRA